MGGEPVAPRGERVSSATEAAPDHSVGPAPLTITLCDGSQFTFSPFADLRVTTDV
jgi:hypothetical protein